MAVAASICFELCQQVYDAFGCADPDNGIKRGVTWGGYQLGVKIGLIQSMTGDVVDIPLADGGGDDRFGSYPEPEAALALLDRGAEDKLIVRDERTGRQYTPTYQVQLHRKIRAKARRPAEIKFTSFQHGRITGIATFARRSSARSAAIAAVRV